MPLRFVFTIIIVLPIALVTSRVDGRGSAPPPLVSCALAKYDVEGRGVIGYKRHLRYAQRIPTMNDDYRIDSMRLRVDHKLIAAAIYQRFDGARKESQDELRADQKSLDSAPFQNPYAKYPFNVTASTDYSYAAKGSPAPSASPSAQFHVVALVRDGDHGDGDIWIDPVSCHFEKLVLTPSRFPSALEPFHVSGEVEMSFSATANGLQDISTVKVHFAGRRGLLSGTIDYDEVYDEYKRFDDVAQAKEALAHVTP